MISTDSSEKTHGSLQEKTHDDLFLGRSSDRDLRSRTNLPWWKLPAATQRLTMTNDEGTCFSVPSKFFQWSFSLCNWLPVICVNRKDAFRRELWKCFSDFEHYELFTKLNFSFLLIFHSPYIDGVWRLRKPFRPAIWPDIFLAQKDAV